MSSLASTSLLPQFGPLSHTAAERWIGAALAQAAALHEHDAWLYPHEPARLPTAEKLHDAWREWVELAESVLRAVKLMCVDEKELGGVDALDDEVGYAQAMLKLPPAEANRRRTRAFNGDVHTIEEVRRELRLGHRR